MRKLNATVLGIITAAIAVVGGQMIMENPEAKWNTCQVVQQGEVGNGTWDMLMEKGWSGDAGDNMEAIYSPACN
jgi:hypothetical protein